MAEPPCIRERTREIVHGIMLAATVAGLVLTLIGLGVWLVRMALHFDAGSM